MGSRFLPAVTPLFGVRWVSETGWFLAAHEMLHFLPARSADNFGAYNHISAGFGRAWQAGDLHGGVSLPSYIMTACHDRLCGRVWGFGIGAYLQAAWWPGPLGLSASVNVDWVGGASLVLPAGLVAMGVAGPLFRW